MSDRLLRAEKVAEIFDVSTATIRKWVFLKILKPVRIGRAIRFRESDINNIVVNGLRHCKDDEK